MNGYNENAYLMRMFCDKKQCQLIYVHLGLDNGNPSQMTVIITSCSTNIQYKIIGKPDYESFQ